jgi:hypothetical protein
MEKYHVRISDADTLHGCSNTPMPNMGSIENILLYLPMEN